MYCNILDEYKETKKVSKSKSLDNKFAKMIKLYAQGLNWAAYPRETAKENWYINPRERCAANKFWFLDIRATKVL